MRKGICFLFASAVALLAIGACGGSGGGGGTSVARTLAGFVYVLGSTGSATPNAVILPTATPPAGFFAPTAGTVTVAVADGVISRSPDSEVFNMAAGNAIICSVTANENEPIQITGTGLQYNSAARTLPPATSNVGTVANTGTVLTINTGSSTYTPGSPAQLRYTIDGVGVVTPTQPFVAGAPAGVLAIVALDSSGVIVPTATFNVTASNAGVAVSGTNPGAGPFNLTPASTATPAGAVDVTVDTVGVNLQALINGDFTHGTVTSIDVTGLGPFTKTWQEAGAVETQVFTALVKNQFGQGMPGVAVDWRSTEADTGDTGVFTAGGTNVWNTASAGSVFTALGGPTDPTGSTVATWNCPTSVPGPLATGDKQPKGLNNVVAFVGAVNSNTVAITMLRPIAALSIVGPSRVDTNTTTPTTGGQAYILTGATDVDNDSTPLPTGTVTWGRTNVIQAGTVGNTGDTSAKSTSNSTINATTGQLTAGSVAGQVTVTASVGAVTSNIVTTEVFGVPSKLVLVPDTVASAIPSARGEYLFANAGDNQAATVTLQDSSGHVVPPGEVSGLTTQYTIQALTGGSITPGGAGVVTFTVTCGTVDGLFNMLVSGSWTGAQGGSGSINLTRDVGQNAP